MHYCYFCHKRCKKLPAHLKRKHPNEEMVQKYMNNKPNSQEANDELTMIRNMGDNRHNQRVVHANAGELILPRLPSAGTKISDFVVCTYCYMWTKDISKHLGVSGRCKAPGKKTIPMTKNTVVVSASKQYKEYVLDHFVKDNVSAVIINDDMLTRLGNDSIAKVQGNKMRLGKYVSRKVRLCGKILLSIRKNNRSENSMYGYLGMGNYDLFTKAVKELCIQSDEGYISPTTAIKAGELLVELCNIKRDVASKAMNEDDRKDVESLTDHLQQRWTDDVTNVVCDHFAERVQVPVNEDLQTISEFLKTLTLQANEPKTLCDFKALVRIVEARLMLVNKRQPDELESIL